MSEDRRPPDDQEPTWLGSSEFEIVAEESVPVEVAPPDEPEPLHRLGDFELLRELGRGGMGIVYEARQLSLNRRVALKLLPPGLGLTGAAVQRFEREARAAARLHHTNIVPVYAIGEDEGNHFYVMELIEGEPLSRVLKELRDDETGEAVGRKWFATVARQLADVADALHYAHQHDVIHRDVKPANLMLSRDGRLCLTDFGLARVAQEPCVTATGSFLGTPAYMSPEQVSAGGMPIDHRTDIYSLGMVLYETLALRRAFGGETREQVVSDIVTGEATPLRRIDPRVPLDLETICQKAMEKDPDRRYASAGEMAEDLRRHLHGEVIGARRTSIARRAWKWIRRHPVAATACVALLIVASATAVAWQAGGRSEEAQRLVADARLALREGLYRDGLETIDRAVAMEPDSIEARLVRARLLMKNWRMSEAADEARHVLREEPDHWTAHAILAALARWPAVQYRQVSIPAEEHLRVVETNAPEGATAYFLRAMIAETLTERVELLDRALELDPADSVALSARINAATDLKDYDQALATAERLIAARPRSARGWRMKASTYRRMGNLDEARRSITRALTLDGGDPWNYIQRGWIEWDEGNVEAAASDVTQAIDLWPEHAWAYRQRAKCMHELGRHDEAVADARHSIELNPEYRTAYFSLAGFHLERNDEEATRRVLDELRGEAQGWADPDAKASVHEEIASFYRRLGDLPQALASVERAIELRPGLVSSLVERRAIHEAMGNLAAAAADCAAAAGIELPDEPAKYTARGKALSDPCGRHEEAIEDYTRAIELAPRWFGGYQGRGRGLAALGRNDEALADLNRAVELNPTHAESYRSRAEVLCSLGRHEECEADRLRANELESRAS